MLDLNVPPSPSLELFGFGLLLRGGEAAARSRRGGARQGGEVAGRGGGRLRGGGLFSVGGGFYSGGAPFPPTYMTGLKFAALFSSPCIFSPGGPIQV